MTSTGAQIERNGFRRPRRAATLSELEATLEREKAGQAVQLRSHDLLEGAAAFQQRRKPNFTD
jgi:enoyl-CoA hydratase